MLEQLKAALEATGYPFTHFGWSHAPAGTYGVWSEDGGADFAANGHHAERGTPVVVDLFTRDDSRTPRNTVEAALNALPCPWRYDSVQFEAETGLIHHQWRLAVYG